MAQAQLRALLDEEGIPPDPPDLSLPVSEEEISPDPPDPSKFEKLQYFFYLFEQ